MEPVFDYVKQAWVQDGKYVRCGHLPSMGCDCYGRLHAGEAVNHQQDEDCTVEDGVCVVCLVDHSETCPECGGRGFHKMTCISMLAVLSEAQR
ncbi:MAG: hypothetical protein WB608_16200 [Terracidiphilus sp.]